MIYIVETANGQETFSPAEFADRYGWKNDPAQIGLASGGRKPPVDSRQAIGDPTAPLGALALVSHPPALRDDATFSIESATPLGVRNSAVVALQPGGQLLAIGGRDGQVRLFDWAAGKAPKLVKLLIGHESPVVAVDWSRDGEFVASVDLDQGNVRVWQAKSGRLVSSAFVDVVSIHAMSWSPGGDAVVVCGVGGLRLIEPNSGELLPGLAEPRIASNVWYSNVSWSPDGKWLAVGAGNPVSWIWDATTGAVRYALSTLPDSYVFWSPDGKSLVSFAYSGESITVWNSDDGTIRRTFPVPRLSNSQDVLPYWLDNATIVVRCGEEYQAWNIDTGTRVDADKRLSAWRSVDGNVVVSISGDGIEIRDETSGRHRTITWAPFASFAELSPGGRRLAVPSDSGDMCIWDETAPREVTWLPTRGTAYAIRWIGDDRSLLVTVAIPNASRVFPPSRTAGLRGCSTAYHS